MSDHALDGIMNAMNNMGQPKAKPDLPEPDPPADLTPEQMRLLDELPEEAGFYWVDHVQTGERLVAHINRNVAKNTVRHWGEDMHATPGGIGRIERWLDQWVVISPVEPCKAPADDYSENPLYGAF